VKIEYRTVKILTINAHQNHKRSCEGWILQRLIIMVGARPVKIGILARVVKLRLCLPGSQMV
jgi:hypothetical protein